MGDMIKTMFSSFTDVIEGLGNGIKVAFTTLIYEDPNAAEKVLSDPAQFAFIVGGAGLAIGVVFGLFRLIKRRGH